LESRTGDSSVSIKAKQLQRLPTALITTPESLCLPLTLASLRPQLSAIEGVDFSAVDLVLQVGSSKVSARLLQRAGRSGHQPGAESRLIFVPTNALE